jgi:hypothetical protein
MSLFRQRTVVFARNASFLREKAFFSQTNAFSARNDQFPPDKKALSPSERASI